MSKKFRKIIKEIKLAKNIAIFCHRSPDMDCFGAMYALSEALESLNKKVTKFCAENLTLNQKVLIDEKQLIKKEQNAEIFDLFISVDVASANMLGDFEDYFINFPMTIKIDHHMTGENDSYALINYVDSEKSSCCEIILELLEEMKVNITSSIATYLYAGLSSDTNSFVNTNTNINSLQTASKLLKLSANNHKVNDAEYRLVPRKSIDIKKLFYDKLKIHKEGFATCLITQSELKANKAEKSDCSTFSSEMLAIEGVNISCSIIELEDKQYALSFRSRKGYNVNEIASVFGGGGHLEASGARIEGEEEKVISRVLKTIKDYLEKGKDNEWLYNLGK